MKENLEKIIAKPEERKMPICKTMWERTYKIGMHLYSEKICSKCNGYNPSCISYSPKIN